jgi:sugar/nucleoside kinase (ribokinase family)
VTPRRPTIREVAAAAGVSVGTVSNVLNGRPAVRAATRAAVEAAVARLGYRPDPAARRLIARRGRTAPAADPATPRLACVGYVCADTRVDVAVLPHRDDRALAGAIEQRLGGRAANVAATAAGFGAPLPIAAELLSVVGDDGDSDWAAATLAERGVVLATASHVPGARLSRCIILVEPNGHRTILNEALQVAADRFRAWLATAGGGTAPRMAYVQADQLAELWPVIATEADATERFATHLVGRDVERLGRDTIRALVARFDLVVFARGAARAFTGAVGGDDALAPALAAAVADAPGRAALTLGPEGAVLIEGGAVVAREPGPAVAPVDTTGAGDVFTAALIAAGLHGYAAPGTLRFAVTAAGLSIRSKGAQDHGLTAVDILV